MIPALFYGAGCFFVAVVITILVSMFKSIESRDDWKSWRVMAFAFCFALAGPYIWCEVLTKMKGGNMKKLVEDTMYDAGIDGELDYYKVIWLKDGKARVIAVATEKASWGGTDRPLVAITMAPKGTEWEMETYRVVRSDERNEDGFSFPPFF